MAKQRKFGTLDCETDPFKRGRIPAPFIWGFYDGEKFTYSESLDEIIELIVSRDIIVYAHNGGKFDFHYMFDHLEAYSEVMIINGRIAKFKIGEAEFRDSYLIIPTALKAFKKDDFDYSLLESKVRYKQSNWQSIVKYLESDCRNLYEYVAAFVGQYGMNLTVAGTAMKQWQVIADCQAPRSDKLYYDTLKPFYYGGRVQAFQTGVIDVNFNVFDINSAYPRAMLDKHPIGLGYKVVSHDVDYFDNYGACFFEVTGISRGALPFRDDKKALTFPNDDVTRTYFVTGWELLAARETNTFSGIVGKSYIFSEFTDFKSYIEYFYNERQAAKAMGDKAGDIFNKLLMNGLYGKFGSDPSDYNEYVIVPQDDISSISPSGYNLAGELGVWLLASKSLNDDDMRFYNVATSASITGFVRAYLFKSIMACGVENVLYCDTDSIATTSVEKLTLSDNLGDWKNEGQFDKAGISGKKLYIFRGVLQNGKREYKIASKGARLTNSQLWQIANGGEVTYKPENPSYSVHNGINFVNRRISATF